MQLNKFIPLLSLSLCLGNFSFAQTQDTLSNNTVIQLHSAGLSDDIILSKIKSSPNKFDLSTDNLIGLKKSGISDLVIGAMQAKLMVPSAPSAPSQSSANAPSVPSAPVTAPAAPVSTLAGQDVLVKPKFPGVFYLKNGVDALSEIEPSVYSIEKVGTSFVGSIKYGLSKKDVKAILSGSNANFLISGVKPVFVFLFAPNGGFGSNNDWFSNATSPNEFVLVKFKSSRKTRDVVTGPYGDLAGFTSGIPAEDKINFRFEKQAPGQYKVYFDQPLVSGEYGFLFPAGALGTASSNSPQKVIDFEIK